MAYKKDTYYDENTPAWARTDGVQYKAGFHGTAKQKKESDRVLAEVLSHRHKRKRGGKK